MKWLGALLTPEVGSTWTIEEWDRVIRIARRLRLLARLATSLSASGLIEQVPLLPRRHLLAELKLSRWRSESLTWTVRQVGAALQPSHYPCVLLKGAAYMAQGLPIAAGRLPSDLDILVPKAALAEARESLSVAGWRTVDLDEHDQRYYEEWSHEVPPMRHPRLGLELDLHHNILPPVGDMQIDATALLGQLQKSNWHPWSVLHPVDQVLHCAAHLFFDSELRDRIRDLVDLDGLFRHFGSNEQFWTRLVDRSSELGLAEPLALACHFCVRWLGTPIPRPTQMAVNDLGLSTARRAWLVPLLNHVLTPSEPDDLPSLKTDAAAAVVLARYHWRRLPMRHLLPHLWHKVRITQRSKE
jgi:hypothetical protein